MPRNVTGGSGHKAQKNSEGGKERNNRLKIDALMDDYLNNANTDGVYVGRVLKRLGCGRMEVWYVGNRGPVQTNMPMCGALRGKGKKSVWVDVDSLVLIADTGFQSGITQEIVAVFSDDHIRKYKKLCPDADQRLFLKGGDVPTAAEESGFEFEHEAKEEEDEVNIDTI